MRRASVLLALALAVPAGCLGGGDPEWALQFEASSFVRPLPYPVLLVEIDHPDGRPPSAMAIDALAERLREVTAKREVRFAPPEPFRPHSSSRSVEEISDLQREVRSFETGGDTIVLHVLYADSVCREGEWSALGYAGGGEAVVCIQAIDEGLRVGPIALDDPSRERMERAVLVHEVGHVLGLVNLGAPMVRPHEDTEHPGHSASRDSVMFWQMDAQEALLGFLADEVGPTFAYDADDLADLKALREGRSRT